MLACFKTDMHDFCAYIISAALHHESAAVLQKNAQLDACTIFQCFEGTVVPLISPRSHPSQPAYLAHATLLVTLFFAMYVHPPGKIS